MLPLNYFRWLHESVSLVPVENLAASHDLRPGQRKVMQRFYSINSVAKYCGTHNEMFSELINDVVEKNEFLKNEKGLIIYAKTQTHNTFFDNRWLSDIAHNQGLGRWESATLSLNHCATALSAIHLFKKKALKNKQPVILLTGEKAFHKDVNKLENGLLAELPCAVLLNAGRAAWNISGSVVKHLPGFHNNHRDKSQAERREIYATLDDKIADFYFQALSEFNLTLDDIDLIVPSNLDMPQLKRVIAKIKYRGNVFFENVPDYGHAYCSDIPFNLATLLQSFNGKRILCVSMGMGMTLSCILIEKE